MISRTLTTILLVLIPLSACLGEPAEKAPLPAASEAALALDGTVYTDTTVEASCGQCQFDLGSEAGAAACDLAVRVDGVALFVEGTGIDDHGDSHGADGFCNAIREAKVSGKVAAGRFVSDAFALTDG
jgi:hypothetical protein